MSSSRRKNSKGSEQDEDRKQRGRPRVEPQDETPQDRRRTQIRLAQRAYRQRKEVTITALRQRATELKGVVNQMNDSFVALQNGAFAAGIETTYPVLASQMRATATKFNQLVRAADQGIDEILDGEAPGTGIGTGLPNSKRNSDDDSGSSSVDGGPSNKRQRQNSTPPLEQYDTSLSSIWGYSVMQPTRNGDGQQMPGIMLGDDNPVNEGTGDISRYDLTMSSGRSGEVTDLEEQQRSGIMLANSFDKRQGSNPLLSSLAFPTSQSPLSRSNSFRTKNPISPYSLAHAETTFARRLHRTCLERGYYNVSHNLIRPEVFKRKFRLSLLYGNQTQFKERLRQLLKRGVGESLEWEDHPMISLGGAGTHYPRRDADGNIVARPNTYAVGPVVADGKGTGRRVKLVKQAEPDPDSDESRDRTALAQKKDLIVDITGYEGEWFDPGDVEGYLREKGINIKAQADFAEAEIDNDELGYIESPTDPFFAEFLTIDTPMQESPPILAKDQYFLPPPTAEADGSTIEWSWPENNLPTPPLQSGSEQDFWGSETFQFPTNNTEPSEEVLSNISQRRYMEKKRITLDVGKLVNELCKRGACLGRTPGFRRKDVDRAFHASIAAF